MRFDAVKLENIILFLFIQVWSFLIGKLCDKIQKII